ncbi:MAG: signal peptidase II [Clostridia bacterium]|nr:signal peptidase II [Clostridia bacterium]
MVTFFTALFSVLALDQLTKTLLWGREGILIPGVMNIANIKNTGTAMNVLSFMPPWLHFAAAVLAVAAITGYVVVRRPSGTLKVFLGLVAGGALGNLLDRMFRGYVADLFETVFVRFYVFNLADAAIVVGCIACAAAALLGKDGGEEREKADDGSNDPGQPQDR